MSNSGQKQSGGRKKISPFRELLIKVAAGEEVLVETTNVDEAATLDQLADAALRAFFNIAKAWALTESEQMKILGLRSRSTLNRWKKGAVTKINRDALERVSYVLGIYKATHILLPDRDNADAWIRKPNKAPLFGGKSALDRMTAGNVSDLFVVRQYVDAECW